MSERYVKYNDVPFAIMDERKIFRLEGDERLPISDPFKAAQVVFWGSNIPPVKAKELANACKALQRN